MASVVATFQDGDKATATGAEKMMRGLFEASRKATPENIRTYRYLTLYDDNGMPYESCMHLNKEQTESYYKRIQNRLRNAQMPLYGVEDDVVADLIGFTREAFYTLGNAFIAWHITERQGGCWVFE